MTVRLACAALACAAILFSQTPLTPAQKKMLDTIDAGAPDAVALLEKLVNINSGSFNPNGVKSVAAIMEAELRALGFETRYIHQDALKRAPHLVAERKGRGGKPLLLIGHMDTVFEPSSPFQKFVRNGRTATGPGTSDMKGGLVVMLASLKGLKAAGMIDSMPLKVFLTGDEESTGEPLSEARKDLIEAGKNSIATLCFETGVRGVDKDYASTARRGFVGWTLKSTGKAGHSGGIFSEAQGHGAIFELSRVIHEFHQQLPEPNMTFNAGLLLGGGSTKADDSGNGEAVGKPNIVAAEAMARGEVRALSPEQVARLKDKMYAIAARSLPGTKTELIFEEGYPPMAPTPGNKRLLALLNEGSRAAGLGELGELDPMRRGAGDVSFVAPYVDSLTGLGAIGSCAHAVGEAVDLESIPKQAKRAAMLIQRLAGK